MTKQRYLIVDGKTFNVSGMSFKDDGRIATIQIYDDYTIRSFVNIDSTLEGVEKIDFETCYVEVEPAAEERLIDFIKFSKEELDKLAHGAIPQMGVEYSESEMYENFANYHMGKAYLDGLEDALKLIQSEIAIPISTKLN